MMATITRQQLATKALNKVNPLGTGQSAEAEDIARIDPYIDTAIDHLSELSIYDVADPEEIEASAGDWIAFVVAFFASEEWSIPPDLGKLKTAENALIRLTASRPTRETLVVDYF